MKDEKILPSSFGGKMAQEIEIRKIEDAPLMEQVLYEVKK